MMNYTLHTLIILSLIACTQLLADDLERPLADPEDREFPEGYEDVSTDPQTGQMIQKHVKRHESAPQENFNIQPVHDNEPFWTLMGDRLEYHWKEGKDATVWDLSAWYGGDYNKLYLESEGHYVPADDEFEEFTIEAFYGRNIASFWDVKIGVRHDLEPNPERTFAAVGFEGMAPQWWEVEATAYVSEDGDASISFEAEYDLRITQRLFLQPRVETELSAQEVEAYDVGQGFTGITAGLRLRYEIWREFAPYIGVSWSRKLGETADLVEASGGDIESVSWIVGIRFWF